MPTKAREKLMAIKAVLSALNVLHMNGIYHCDVHWTNIKHSCAVLLAPGLPLGHLSLHAPEAVSGPAADLWMVMGKLVTQSDVVMPPMPLSSTLARGSVPRMGEEAQSGRLDLGGTVPVKVVRTSIVKLMHSSGLAGQKKKKKKKKKKSTLR
eukprot:TRINITY_DN3505_c0_g1_i1.p1 TRINITY_DN3505_c0_g1~~TRINITY_DN3505_c0_g1_i1.p1  ORF type:complete len:175 (+),score=65.75 TRINITY_DN3505_c0_g1_i1:70-525(+)